jgi:YfiH family protein
MLLRASKFPAAHGFSTRAGGVSEGVYRSMNLGWSVGDQPSRVAENFRRLAHHADFPLERLHTLSQVHGDRVIEVQGNAPETAQQEAEADALWTQESLVVVGVKTADCMPILLAAPRIGLVAAIHSGWRGTLAEIAARAVEQLFNAGARPSDLWAAIARSGEAVPRTLWA